MLLLMLKINAHWQDFLMLVWHPHIFQSLLIFVFTTGIEMEDGTDHVLRVLDTSNNDNGANAE
jgi:hypothetical protein